jgi:glucokinase
VKNTYLDDPRIVLTLDAGGTSFRFSATQRGRMLFEHPPVPSCGDDLPRCIQTLIDGFEELKNRCPSTPVAISFAFPGPADYPAGIIGDLPNLPAFRGGVPLGPILSDRFGLPVYVNNDGNLFAYGEAIAGFLPFVNNALAQRGATKRFKNLLGVTLGTGFGGGIVHDHTLFAGDNSAAGEVWLLRNKLEPEVNADEGASIRSVRRAYAELAGLAFDHAPDPKLIGDIARGAKPGNQSAAIEAYHRLGEVSGDAIAQALTLVDGLVAVGGGLSKAADLFMPALVAAMNGVFGKTPGPLRRLGPRAFNFDELDQRDRFLAGNVTELVLPGSSRKIYHEKMPRTAVGVSRLGTTEAITLGAYVFALRHLDDRDSPFTDRP